MGTLAQLGSLVMPANISPGSPVTYEMLVDLFAQLSQLDPDTGLTADIAISDSATNTALVTTPVLVNPAAGTVWQMEAWGIYSTPGSGPATMSWIVYSGGSGGTALATIPAITPGTTLTSCLWRATAAVDFYSATAAQCELTVLLGTSASTDAASAYLASPTGTTGVTITTDEALSLNFVFGSAVSGSTLTALGGYCKQLA
jgi:hypothetical protein